MGIYDREYVRVGPRSKSGLGAVRFISVNSWLIIINVVVFVLGAATPNVRGKVQILNEYEPGVTERQKASGEVETRVRLPLTTRYPTWAHPIYATTTTPDGRRVVLADPLGRPVVIGKQVFIELPLLQALGHFSTLRGFFGLEVWRFVTFQFLHGSVSHIFFNMFGLWVFGGMVEQYLGSRRYAAFYLTCGIFGAISYLILNLLGYGLGLRLPGVLIDEPWTPLIGASAGVFGVILACAYIAPEAIIQLIFPPLPLKLKWFAYGYVVIAAWNLFSGGANAGGDAAHIGGAISGYFFIRNAHLLRDFFDIFGGRATPAARVGAGGELDRILSKVKTEGLASLTAGERQSLREATERRRRG